MKAAKDRPAVPISACLLAEALLSKAARKKLAARAVYIRVWRALSYWPCRSEEGHRSLTGPEWDMLVDEIPDLQPLREHVAQIDAESEVLV